MVCSSVNDVESLLLRTQLRQLLPQLIQFLLKTKEQGFNMTGNNLEINCSGDQD